MIRWLVVGASGRLGRDLVDVLAGDARSWVVAANRASLDLADAEAVRTAVTGFDVVVNVAAWTDVDAAERHESAAYEVNAAAVARLARACRASAARLLHVSTDYVFGSTDEVVGSTDRAVGERTPARAGWRGHAEDAPAGPLNAYGRGKLAGERAVLTLLPETGYVVRTAWLYGEHGENFLTTMLRLAARRETVEVVDDQFGQPTWTLAVAEQLRALGQTAMSGQAPSGVFHATATGRTSWYGFAREIFERSGLDPDRVRPISAAQRPVRPARRPTDSTLSHARWAAAGLPGLAGWREQLDRALSTPKMTALRRGR